MDNLWTTRRGGDQRGPAARSQVDRRLLLGAPGLSVRSRVRPSSRSAVGPGPVRRPARSRARRDRLEAPVRPIEATGRPRWGPTHTHRCLRVPRDLSTARPPATTGRVATGCRTTPPHRTPAASPRRASHVSPTSVLTNRPGPRPPLLAPEPATVGSPIPVRGAGPGPGHRLATTPPSRRPGADARRTPCPPTPPLDPRHPTVAAGPPRRAPPAPHSRPSPGPSTSRRIPPPAHEASGSAPGRRPTARGGADPQGRGRLPRSSPGRTHRPRRRPRPLRPPARAATPESCQTVCAESTGGESDLPPRGPRATSTAVLRTIDVSRETVCRGRDVRGPVSCSDSP